MSMAWQLLTSAAPSLHGCSGSAKPLCCYQKLTAPVIHRGSSGYSRGLGQAGHGRGCTMPEGGLIGHPQLGLI